MRDWAQRRNEMKLNLLTTLTALVLAAVATQSVWF